jgi:hypothetical protein
MVPPETVTVPAEALVGAPLAPEVQTVSVQLPEVVVVQLGSVTPDESPKLALAVVVFTAAPINMKLVLVRTMAPPFFGIDEWVLPESQASMKIAATMMDRMFPP